MSYGIFGGSALGAVALGATAPSPVCTYFQYECQNWNSYPPDVQSQILAAAKQADAGIQAQYVTIRNEGGCDATVAGRLAGALKEKLIVAGADTSKLDPGANVFGSKDCAEWWRIFNRGVTLDDLKGVTTATVGGVQTDITTICQGKISLPNCIKPPTPVVVSAGGGGGGGGGGPIVPMLPSKPKMSTASMLAVGGAVAGVSVLGYFVAKKKGWIK